MSIIERSIRQPVAVTVCVLLVVIFGLLGLLRVPVQLTPNVDQPVIRVTTRWFGASPQEIAREIIEEQEEVLKSVEGLREMTSQSVEGEGTINLQFHVGVDKYIALNEVRDKLRQVPEYPAEVDEPVVESITAASDDAIAWLLIRPLGGRKEAISEALASGKAAPGFDGNVTSLQDFLEDEVQPVLERVEGVARAQVFGGRERELQVTVDLQKLAARGISISQLTTALQRENQDVTAGAYDTRGKSQVSVRAVGQYDDPEQILNTVIAYTDAGAPVYVRDVADARLDLKRQVGFVRSEGEDVVAIRVQRETGVNVMAVMKELKLAIRDVNANVLGPRNWGIELEQVYDETVYIDRSVRQAADDLMIGALLAAVVLFLTLRSIGATLVVAVSIPISVVGTFLGMALTGRNLNVISMAGLSFAIGMGVDNTIVVLENIFRHREMGKDRLRAALDGAREVWGAIVAATLANIAVFLPVVFIQEEAGQLFRDISVAISISLMLYMLVSPTVIPMLATLFLRKMPGGFVEDRAAFHEEKPQTWLGRLTRPVSRVGASMSAAFYRIVLWLTAGVVRRLALVILMVGAASLLSVWLMPPRTYLPTGNQNFVFGLMFPPPGYNLEEFKRIAHQVEAQLRPWWEVAPDPDDSPELAEQKRQRLEEQRRQWRYAMDNFVIPGMQQQVDGMKASMPPEQFEAASAPLRQQIQSLRTMPPPSPIENYFFVAYQGGLFMGGTSSDPENVKPLAALLSGAMQGIPGTPGFAIQVPIFHIGREIGSTIEVNLSGMDYDKVRQAAAPVQGMMSQKFMAYAQSNPSNFDLGRPELRVMPDRVRAAAAGITIPTIRDMTQVAVDGLVIGDYRYEGRNIDLTVVAGGAREQRDVNSIRDVPMAAANGWVMPLSAVADFLDTAAAQQINRLERLPAVGISVQLPPGMTVQEAQGIVQTEILEPLRAQGVIPAGVNVTLTGSADKLRDFMRAFLPGFLLAAAVTYLLLAALFESWLHPFVIIMSVPFALVGGFLGLRIIHTIDPSILLDVLTMLGFVILVGTIVNNPILIVHQALNYMREGMDRQHAIALSTQTRVRPIFMSVITSVAGMAPLVVFGGAGSELYRGLGAVVVGGLLLSTVFTLFLTPTLMSLMLDIQAGLKALFGGVFAARRDTSRPPAPAEAKPPRQPEPDVVTVRSISSAPRS